MKIKFENDPDPLQIMKILADLLEDESGGEYVYEVCQDGKPIGCEGDESSESGESGEDGDREDGAEKREMESVK